MPRKRSTTQEDRLTDALILDVLLPSPPSVGERFAREVCGVESLGALSRVDVQLSRYFPLPAPRAVVVGIARQRGIALKDRSISGKAIPDGLICGSETAVLLEHKLGASCEQGQLVRHALYWALDVDRDEPIWPPGEPLPDGYQLASWSDVLAWTRRERTLGECDEAALTALERLLEPHAVADPVTSTANRDAARTVAVLPAPAPVPLSTIRSQWDLDLVYEKAAAHVREHPVGPADCLESTLKMRESFERAGRRPPAGLRWHGREGAMTPPRVLTVMYTGKNLSDAWPEAWTGWWMRMVDRGADQAALAAMLAWGLRQRDTRRTNTVSNVPLVWSLASTEPSPGLENLHRALAPARR